MFDFTSISSIAENTLINPRDIFASLTNRRYERLRAEQVEVLGKWFDRRNDQRNFAIQMNTGSGKTIVGLLIGLSGMRELEKPSVVLVPNKFLVQQTLNEALNLGIPATDDANSIDFRSGDAILVATIHKMFNGRNVFASGKHLLDSNFGTIVIDDAHASTAIVEQQFSITFPNTHTAYNDLLTLFSNDLKEQNVGQFIDLMNNNGGVSFLPVPLDAVHKKRDEIASLLSRIASNSSSDDPSYFSYPLLSEHPELLTITFSSKNVEISPLLPEIRKISAFDNAERRVFLSATYLDCDDLIKVFDVNLRPAKVKDDANRSVLISPDSASDCGDRLIIPINSIDSRLKNFDVAKLIQELRDTKDCHSNLPINISIIVPSSSRAEFWEKAVGAHIVSFNDNGDAPNWDVGYIKKVNAGVSVEPLVFVNRYDGLSLANSACRLLVLDGVPQLHSARKQRKAAALKDTPIHSKEIAKALEQGMGRGVRGAEDYCVVILLGDESALAARQKARCTLFTPVLQKQIELGNQVCLQAKKSNDSIAVVKEAIELFLSRDPTWLKLSREATAQAKYQDESPSDFSIAERQAFNKACNRDYKAAVRILRAGIDTLNNKREKCWYMEELAHYQEQFDFEASQKTLLAAREYNPIIIKPDQFVPTPKNLANMGQVNAIYSNLSQCETASDVYMVLANYLEGFVWGRDADANHDESIIEQLGHALGFESTRPEHELGDGGPDNLWRSRGELAYVIELKTGVFRSKQTIIKDEAAQLGSSMNWLERGHQGAHNNIPVLFHPYANPAQDASLPPNTLIMTEDDTNELFNKVDRFARYLGEQNRWRSEEAIQNGLLRYKLNCKAIFTELAHRVR
ncbi:DEAD/DEAH box helicase family protein [Thermophilibacter sp.]